METELINLVQNASGPVGAMLLIGFFLWKKITKIETVLADITIRVTKIETILEMLIKKLEKQ